MKLTAMTWKVGSRLLILMALTLSSCATETMVHPAGIDQKLETASVRADHEEIASMYEQQAGRDKAAAEYHARLAASYRGRTSRNIPPEMAGHCENLARLYRQAADEHLALAKEHRRIAYEMK